MSKPRAEAPPTTLGEVLDKLGEARRGRGEELTIGNIVETIGRRSFGPLLLVAGLLAVSPLTGIPGVPTTLGLLVALIAGQLLLRRKRLWLPAWIEHRHVRTEHLATAVRWLRRPARVIDRLLRPRLEGVTEQGGLYAIALVCALIGVVMPSLELVPFSAHLAGIAVTGFGLALIAHDGLVGLCALAVTGGVAAFAVVRIVA
jgi:hypothetical protein